ncbi:MAG TPA: SMC-Scp complex subunit ScpB [Gammaproteobacteria bacterium]|nr:SMC-Scp complex subunit ScpB [Gammaproteobacteria bacterium]
MDEQQLKNIVEAALLAAGEPLSIDKLLGLFPEDQRPERDAVRQALAALDEDCASRGIELKEVSSGFRLQVRSNLAEWVGKLWEERPPRYSRALLETLALIAYRQPITRAEIEEIRGVTVSTHIMKTLQERDWVRVVGHRDVPGKPAMYATTKDFLDYFNLKSLDELPTLAEIRDIDRLNEEFELSVPVSDEPGTETGAPEGDEHIGEDTDEIADTESQSDDEGEGGQVAADEPTAESAEADEPESADRHEPVEQTDPHSQAGQDDEQGDTDAEQDPSDEMPAEPPLSAER